MKPIEYSKAMVEVENGLFLILRGLQQCSPESVAVNVPQKQWSRLAESLAELVKAVGHQTAIDPMVFCGRLATMVHSVVGRDFSVAESPADRIAGAMSALQEVLDQGVTESWAQEDLCHVLNHLAQTREQLEGH